MRTENNGKIAIAVVAMLVVALSIVGVTYAYFVAGVTKSVTDKSVEVTAGILSINYTDGTQELDVANVVPDWETDGEHYYDPTGSVYTVDETTGLRGIKAVTKTLCSGTTLENRCSIDTPGEANGIANGVTFKVSNTVENGRTAYYAIKLVDVKNPTTPAKDDDKIVYTLTRTSDNKTWTGELVATTVGEQVIVDDVISIENDRTGANAHNYTLDLRYPNIDSDQSDPAEGGNELGLKVKVVGIAQGTDGDWYEEYSATPIDFAD